MAADPPEGGGRVVCVHDRLAWSVLEILKFPQTGGASEGGRSTRSEMRKEGSLPRCQVDAPTCDYQGDEAARGA